MSNCVFNFNILALVVSKISGGSQMYVRGLCAPLNAPLAEIFCTRGKYFTMSAIWPTTSVLPAVVVLAHGQPPVWCWTSLVRRRYWETEHLPSPDRVSGTAFLLPSVIRHCRRQSSESCWKLICLFKGRGAGDLWTGALEMYRLTN